MNKDDIIAGIVIFMFGGLTAAFSLGMPIGSFRMAGTGLFPLCLGTLLMGLSLLHLFKLFYEKRKKHDRKQRPLKAKALPGRLILFFGVMVLATPCLQILGYPLTAFFLMVSLLRILGMKRWPINFLVSFPTAAASYFLFVQWLQIPLPKGWIGL